MVVRTSVIFITCLSFNLLLLLIIEACVQYPLSAMEILLAAKNEVFSDNLATRSWIITAILSCFSAGILGAISLKLLGRLHPLFAILACLCAAVIGSIIGGIILSIGVGPTFNITNILFSGFVAGLFETYVICFTWWILKPLYDTKGFDISIAVPSRGRKIRYSLQFSMYILLLYIVFAIFYASLIIATTYNPEHCSLDKRDMFFVILYSLTAAIVAVIAVAYAFYHLRYKGSLKMRTYTRMAVIVTFIVQVLVFSFAATYQPLNSYIEQYEFSRVLPYSVLFFISNWLEIGIGLSLSFWLTRCMAGSFKSVGEEHGRQ